MRKPGRARRFLLMGIALFATCAGLAACGSGTPPIVGRDCGAVHESYRVIGDPSAPEDCLWQAWTRCQSATLVLTRMGVDTGDTHTITVQPGGGACGVTDAAQGYSANFGGSKSQITTYTCAGLERSPDGGLIVKNCGAEGDLMIPPMAPATPPLPPGVTPT